VRDTLRWKGVFGSGGCDAFVGQMSVSDVLPKAGLGRFWWWSGREEKRAAEVKGHKAQQAPFTAPPLTYFAFLHKDQKSACEISWPPITLVIGTQRGRHLRQTPTHTPEERTKTMKCALVLALVLFGLVALGSANPGFKVTLTQNGATTSSSSPEVEVFFFFILFFLFY
jgi:hypothetical protein